MLILTRNIGQALIIGDDIKVTVMGVNGNYVRLGIDSPKDVVVNRQEVHDRMQMERIQQDEWIAVID